MGRFAHVVHLRVNHKELAALRRMADMRECSVEELIRLELRLADGDPYEPAPKPVSEAPELALPQLRIIEGGGEALVVAARPQAQDA
jgi:hypothetical protein